MSDEFCKQVENFNHYWLPFNCYFYRYGFKIDEQNGGNMSDYLIVTTRSIDRKKKAVTRRWTTSMKVFIYFYYKNNSMLSVVAWVTVNELLTLSTKVSWCSSNRHNHRRLSTSKTTVWKCRLSISTIKWPTMNHLSSTILSLCYLLVLQP